MRNIFYTTSKVILLYVVSFNVFSSSTKTIIETLEEQKDILIGRPGCTGVGLGHKYIKGKSTKQPAITVFVEKKLPAEEIPAEHIIPRKINGYDTDVIEQTFSFTFISGNSKTLKSKKKRFCFN